ncbi:MAG: hypothetical protein ACO331_13360 [Prochlorothrix sp.]
MKIDPPEISMGKVGLNQQNGPRSCGDWSPSLEPFFVVMASIALRLPAIVLADRLTPHHRHPL